MSFWVALHERRKPQSEGMYLVFAPSADPKKPLRYVAWWSVQSQGFEGLVPVWLKAITHWSPFPPDPPEENNDAH